MTAAYHRVYHRRGCVSPGPTSLHPCPLHPRPPRHQTK